MLISSNPAEQIAALTAKNAQLEADLRQNKALLEHWTDYLQQVLWLADLDKREVLYVSSAYEKVWGRSRPASMQGAWDQWLSSIHPDDLPLLEAVFVTSNQKEFDIRYRIIRPDGTVRWIRDRGSPIYNPHEQLFQIAGIAEDVTDQVQQEALQQAEQLLHTLNQELEHRVQQRTAELESAQRILQQREFEFRTLVEHSPDMIARHDHELRFIYVNPTIAHRILPASELLGKSIAELDYPAEQRAQWQRVIRQVFETGQPNTIDSTLQLASGEIHLQSLVVPEFENAVVTSVMSTTRDITEVKYQAAQLRQSEERFRRVFEDSPLGMGITTQSGQFVTVNQRLCEILGYSQPELLALTFWDVSHPEDRYKEFELLQELLQHQRDILSLEKRYIRRDGETIWVRVTVTFMKSERGDVQHQINMVEDISDRKAADAKLKTSLHEKEMLLKEIHHRVKNNMQTVSSLLSLQASYIEDPEILEPFTESQNRVKAMALIHERLYRSESLGRVSFPEYVHKLVTDLVKFYQVRTTTVGLEFDIANLELGIDTAIPCGLIVNELVSNSLKHAFPETQSGTICVRLAAIEGDLYQLSVQDDGIGIPANITPYNNPSLGLQLISAFAKKLHATIHIDRSSGTTISIVFPRLQ